MPDLPDAPGPVESVSSRWWSRGYLPHFDSPDVVQHVVFHLADSLPAPALERLADELRGLPEDRRGVERHRRIQGYLDSGHGRCALREPWAAQLVEDALLYFDGDRYRLLAWVVMPNHVHAVVQMLPGFELRRTVASWKSYTGRRLSSHMPDNNPVWLRDHYDRFVRDAEHFAAVVAYVHRNPVKAGLVDRAEDWPWSSAGRLQR